MLKRFGLIMLVLLGVLPIMAQDESSASFVIEGTEAGEYDRAVDSAAWMVEPSAGNIRTGSAFSLRVLEAPEAGSMQDGVSITFSSIPVNIEPGTYELGFGGVGDGRHSEPEIGGDVQVKTGNAFASSSLSSPSSITITERTEETFSGSFALEFREGTITGEFNAIPIPAVENCRTETPADGEESDAVVQFRAESDPAIKDLNFEAEGGLYLVAYAYDSFDDLWTTTLQFASPFDEDGELTDGMIISFINLPEVLEVGEYEITIPSSSFDTVPEANVEYVPGLSFTNRSMEGTLTLSEITEDGMTGSFDLSIIGDDFFDDMEEPFGTVTGTFENIPFPTETDCRAQSWE